MILEKERNGGGYRNLLQKSGFLNHRYDLISLEQMIKVVLPGI